jgi:hypothetical protein
MGECRLFLGKINCLPRCRGIVVAIVTTGAAGIVHRRRKQFRVARRQAAS